MSSLRFLAILFDAKDNKGNEVYVVLLVARRTVTVTDEKKGVRISVIMDYFEIRSENPRR